MNQEGDQGVSQSGFILQNMGTVSPHNVNKRCRDQSEEESHPTALVIDAPCVKAMDLNLSGDALCSDGGGDGREDPSNLTLFQFEKRIKCGPSYIESNSQSPIPSSFTVNVDVMASDGVNNASTGMISENMSQGCADATMKVSNEISEVPTLKEEGTQFRCDICLVKSTSAKDLETHLAGKRHAKAIELASGMGTSCVIKTPDGGSDSRVFTPQKVQASAEHGSPHLNSNMHTTSAEQQGLAEGSDEACKDYNSIGAKMDFWASSSKCPDLNDANAIAVGQHTPSDYPFREALNIDPISKIAYDNGHNRYLCQNVMNGSIFNPNISDGTLLEKICSRIILEGEPYKHLMASLSAKSNSDCVARALAATLNTYGCPGFGDVQEGSSCEQAAGCSDSQLEGAKSADGNGMVTMHARCFSNLLHDICLSVMEDLLRHGGLKTNPHLPSAVAVSGGGEDLNCSVCRVEYGSKADLDLHLAGKKHASLVQRVYSRCQLCNLNCNTERDFKTHLSGKKHASKLRLVQKRVTF